MPFKRFVEHVPWYGGNLLHWKLVHLETHIACPSFGINQRSVWNFSRLVCFFSRLIRRASSAGRASGGEQTYRCQHRPERFRSFSANLVPTTAAAALWRVPRPQHSGRHGMRPAAEQLPVTCSSVIGGMARSSHSETGQSKLGYQKPHLSFLWDDTH